eukprot:Amastigsp_a513376_12.p3 type:complete len:118 gc:universal Amastigsp_a513376_12:89-442(+)
MSREFSESKTNEGSNPLLAPSPAETSSMRHAVKFERGQRRTAEKPAISLANGFDVKATVSRATTRRPFFTSSAAEGFRYKTSSLPAGLMETAEQLVAFKVQENNNGDAAVGRGDKWK